MSSSDDENPSDRKTKCRILDTDSENENSEQKSQTEKSTPEKSSSKKKKIIRALVDSSDDEDGLSSKTGLKSTGSDSDSDEPTKNESFKGGRINRSTLLGSSDLEEESDSEIKPRPTVVSSGDESGSRGHSSDEESGPRGHNNSDGETSLNGKSKTKKSSQSRKAKNNAIKEIYSEAQRMLRESDVGLPYHKPRQRTLDEFLNRKKGTPELISDYKKLPEVGANIEDVERVEKMLKHREKLAEEFFKNDEQEKIGEEMAIDDPPYGSEGESVVQTEKLVESQKVEDDLGETDEQMKTQDHQINSFMKSQSLQDHQTASLTSETNPDESCSIEAMDIDSGRLKLQQDQPDQDQELKSKSDKPNENQIDGKSLIENVAEAEEDEEESLRLFLEPDTETLVADEEEFLPGSQKSEIDSSIHEKSQNSMSKRLAALATRFDLSDKLSKQPKLGKGEITEIVFDELEESVVEPGLETLKNRFVKHVRAKKDPKISSKNVDVISVVRKEIDSAGVTTIREEKIFYGESEKETKDDFEEVRRAQKTERPGAQQVALKLTLKQQIMEAKKLERESREKQKQVDNEEGEEEGSDGDAEEEEAEEEEEIIEDEELSEEEESEEELEDDEDDTEADSQSFRKSRIKCAFIDDEAEDEDGNGEEELEAEDSNNISHPKKEDAEVFPAVTREASDVMNPETDSSFSLMTSEVRWTPLDQRTQEENFDNSRDKIGARKKLGFEGLFDQTDPNPDNFDDVIGLCSGQFITQKSATDEDSDHDTAMTQATQDDSQAPSQTPDTIVLTGQLTQNLTREATTTSKKDTQDTVLIEELSMQETGERAPGFMEEYPGFLDSSDSEKESNPVAEEQKSKKLKKKKRRIVISDDESDEDAVSDAEDSVNDEDALSDAERVVEYDSEENEIDLQPEPVKGLVGRDGRIRGEFLEKEAELSGSDLGSDDEDESGLDRLMMEEGDLDEVDEEKVRDEVGRIHHRQILDEDQREIRLFQEAFLEDGELHSDNTRTRKFRWKNLDDADGEVENHLTQSGDEAEDEECRDDEKWRVERLEREKWMQESESKDVDDVEPSHDDSQFFNLAQKALQKIEAKPKKEISKEPKAKLFKSPKAKQPLQILSGNKRGSFLSRDNSTLEKLAEMTKNTSSTKSGSGAKNSKNFTFAILSPPKNDPIADTPSSSEEVKEKRKKTAKNLNEPLKKKSKIDRSIDENSSDTIFSSF